MKKIFYLPIVVLFALFANKVHAQYTITYSNVSTFADSNCIDPVFSLNTSGFSSGLAVHTYYGDGTDNVNPVMSAFVGGYASYTHTYTSAGTYTVKQVLELGGASIDSLVSFYDSKYCQTFNFSSFYDANGNCVFDSTSENFIITPISIAVDSNGIRVDTFVTTSGLHYQATGNPGDIYAFSVISSGTGLVLTCPAGGVIYDTISMIVNDYISKEFGFDCSGASGYDAGELVTTRAGRHSFVAEILATNQYCSPAGVTVTMNMSPKYDFVNATPVPTTISGHTLTWTFPSLTAITPQYIYVHGEVPGAWLIAGDTVHSSYYITPTAGDGDLSDNTVILVDTVRSSFDPNDKAVIPDTNIPDNVSTKLTYTLRFENTGNDTAFNIHIMDTLSDKLNVKSLAILGSSAAMNLSIQHVGGLNIAKFDFPHINLLDSTHHGLCDGFVTFSIYTQSALPYGTQILNRGGIYFDFNPVVLTNTVVTTVGIPDGIDDMSNVSGSTLQLFPNPADNELTVKISKGTFSTISVINSVGQVLMKQDVNGTSTKLNVKGLPAGSYYISVKGNSCVKVERFQKM